MASAKTRFACFDFMGSNLSLHWSWFLVAAYEIGDRQKAYSSITWNVLEYLALFLIVMLHEFGHALACRQVGGVANQIVLWPLGGVAYVNPPQRPGATLWSIAAGPLVNVVLLPTFLILGPYDASAGIAADHAQWFPADSIHRVDQSRLSAIQPASDLSAGWWTDSSIAALVCDGPGAQPDGRRDCRIPGGGRTSGAGVSASIHVAGCGCGFRLHELFARAKTGPGAAPPCQDSAANRIFLPILQDVPATRRILEMLHLLESV